MKQNQSLNRRFSKVDSVLLILLSTAFVFWFGQSSFFWDTIQLGSKHAYYYYETRLSFSFLPDQINSGHIPFFGYYLALCWKLFGQSLLVSHLALLPFIWSIVFLSHQLLGRFIEDRVVLLITTLVLISEPTLLSQFTLVSPEVVLLSGLLMVIEGRTSKNTSFMMIGMVLLSLISIRGIVVAGCLALWMLWTHERLIDIIKMSLPALAIVIVYYVLHYLSQGWIGVHSDSPWKSSISLVSVRQWFYNIGIMGWRLLDFGRVVWIVIGASLLVNGWSKQRIIDRRYLKLLLILFIVFLLLTTTFAGLTGHRYYLPIILIGLFGVLKEISLTDWSRSLKIVVVAFIFVTQLASHLIVYPRDVAQGWDGSLAYLPYQSLVIEVEDHLVESSYDCSQIGTYFPLRGNSKYRTLEDRGCRYKSANIGRDKFVITSNVMNDITLSDYNQLENQYQVKKRWQSQKINVTLHELK